MFVPLISLMLLSVEANQVVGLRMQRLHLGGTQAWDECTLMMSEKIAAFGQAATTLAGGHGLDRVVSDYRAVVQANIQRLRPDGPSCTSRSHPSFDA